MIWLKFSYIINEQLQDSLLHNNINIYYNQTAHRNK